jgi:hypothetical protein
VALHLAILVQQEVGQPTVVIHVLGPYKFC